jgi:hypothetical protein
MFDYLYRESLSRAEHRVWILSDLQQRLPENTKRCLEAGISDFELLERTADQIWYLGDAVLSRTYRHILSLQCTGL